MLSVFVLVLLVGYSTQAQNETTHFTIIRNDTLYALEIETGTETPILEVIPADMELREWSPDGTMLAGSQHTTERGDRLIIFALEDDTYFTLPLVLADNVLGVDLQKITWSNDNRWIAYTVSYYDPVASVEVFQFYVIEIVKGAQPYQMPDNEHYTLQWLPNNIEFIYSNGMGLFKFNAITQTRRTLQHLPAYIYPSWSSDLTRFAIHTPGPRIGENVEIILYDVETGDSRPVAYAYEIVSQAFSPDGDWLAYEHITRFWGERISVVNLETEQVTEIAASDGELEFLRWSPDGNIILYSVSQNDNIRQFRIVNTATLEDRLVGDDINYVIAWSPDSEWMLYSSNQDGVSALIGLNIVDGRSWEGPLFDQSLGWRP